MLRLCFRSSLNNSFLWSPVFKYSTAATLTSISRFAEQHDYSELGRLPTKYINRIGETSQHPQIIKYISLRNDEANTVNLQYQSAKSEAQQLISKRLKFITKTFGSHQQLFVQSGDKLQPEQIVAMWLLRREPPGFVISRAYLSRIALEQTDVVVKVFMAKAHRPLRYSDKFLEHLSKSFEGSFRNLSGQELAYCLRGLKHVHQQILDKNRQALIELVKAQTGLEYLMLVAELANLGWKGIVDVSTLENTLKKQQTLSIPDIYRVLQLQKLEQRTLLSDQTQRILMKALERELRTFKTPYSRFINRMLLSEKPQIKSLIVSKINREHLGKQGYLSYCYILAESLRNTMPQQEYTKLIQQARHRIPYLLLEEFTPREFQNLMRFRVRLGMDDNQKYSTDIHHYKTKSWNCIKGMIMYFSDDLIDQSSMRFKHLLQKQIKADLKHGKIGTFDMFELLSLMARYNIGDSKFWSHQFLNIQENSKSLPELISASTNKQKERLINSLFGLLAYRFQTTSLLDLAISLLDQGMKHQWRLSSLESLSAVSFKGKLADDVLWFKIQNQMLAYPLEELTDTEREEIVPNMLFRFAGFGRGSTRLWQTYVEVLSDAKLKQLISKMRNHPRVQYLKQLEKQKHNWRGAVTPQE